MTAAAPNICWTAVLVDRVLQWAAYRQHGQPPATVTGLDHVTGPARAVVEASTSGGAQVALSGQFTAGSFDITSASDTSDVVAGQELCDPSGIYLPRWPTAYVTGVSDTEILFSFEDLAYSGDGPLATSSGTVAIVVKDPAPEGTLAIVVSPGSGVTITDTNADGGGDVDYRGDGAAVCNLMGQAVGNAELEFTAAGTFTVTFEFSTGDPNYSAVTLSPSVEFVVA